jgi:hypothetical protein
LDVYGRQIRTVAGRAVGAATAAALVGALAPAEASAHGLGGSTSPGIPGWLFAWGAALALVLSFAALGAFWRRPQLEHTAERRLIRVPAWLEPACGAIGVALFGGLLYAGLFGAQDSLDNILPTWVFVVFWVATPVASAVVGDVFRAFNPWVAIARGLAWVVRRCGASVPEAMPYPPRVGQWPATFTILAFGWVELAFTGRDDPSTLAGLALAYALIQLVGMSLYGIETWRTRADGFGVYFSLYARLAPFVWRDRALWRRRPLSGATALNPLPGTVALVCTALGVTMFDGLSSGPLWLDVVPHLQSGAQSLGLDASGALEAASTLGLVLCVLAMGGSYRLGVSGIGAERTSVLAGRFVHSLLPIALAYVIAHYATLLLFQGQAVASLASDPLGDGRNWLGTASATIDYGFISSTGIWAIQVGAVVAGHIAGLALAHDRALVSARDVSSAVRTQRTMLAIMVGLTSLALWLISSANQ